MRNRFLQVGLAVVVVAVGIYTAILARGSKTLAEQTVGAGESAIVLKILEKDGRLFACATQPKPLGSHSEILIGERDSIGTTDPRVIVEEDRNRVLLCVGRSTVEFDVGTRSLGVPRID
jgi:hypothetical protein